MPADNGIGVAAALALLDAETSVKLPPLECLFTVDEETGLTGAFGLEPSMLSGLACRNHYCPLQICRRLYQIAAANILKQPVSNTFHVNSDHLYSADRRRVT